MVSFLALTGVTLGLYFAFDTVWLLLGVLGSLFFTYLFLGLYRKRLTRFVADETSLVCREPGWKFWPGPAEVLVLPYADSTFYIRWDHNASNPVPSCVVTSGTIGVTLPDDMPEYERLVDHLRTHIVNIDEDRATKRDANDAPLQHGVTLRYGRVEKGWVLLGLAIAVALLVFPSLWSQDSWPRFFFDSVFQIVVASVFASLIWIFGPKLRVDDDGITYSILWSKRRVCFNDLERVEFRNGAIWERTVFHSESTSIVIRHPLSRYQELVGFVEERRPDCFPTPELEFPWIIPCRATAVWLQGLLFGIWTALVCAVLYLIYRSSGLWPLEMPQVLGFAAGMAPAILVVGSCWAFRVRRIEFDEDSIVIVRKWLRRNYATRDLRQIEYTLKATEYQRLTFHLRAGKGKFHLNASQVEIPLRVMLRILHVLYPMTRQAQPLEEAGPEIDIETAREGYSPATSTAAADSRRTGASRP
jgi:hypothetical protein